MKRLYFFFLFTLFLFTGMLAGITHCARAITLEQIISREHPDYHNSTANLTVGRDNMVYLACRSRGYNGFALKMAPDGSGRTPVDTGPAGWSNLTANAAGIMASANEHFTHSVRLYRDGISFAAISDFVNNDQVGYDAPLRVEAGASGDFYAPDQHRHLILRINPSGKVVQSYSYPAGINLVDFRVSEGAAAFYLLPYTGALTCVGMDGKQRWEFTAFRPSGFDADESGHLYLAGANSDTITRLDADGKPGGEIKLEGGALKESLTRFPVSALRLDRDEVLIRRQHPTEIFRRYALATGELRGVVNTSHERLAAAFPSDTWTAGQPVPFQIDYTGPPGVQPPHWKVWAKPYGSVDYHELEFKGGKLQLPPDASGLVQVKVTPEAQPLPGTDSEYLLHTWVQVLKPGSRGTVNAATPSNRFVYGRGEAIPFSVIVRTSQKTPIPIDVRLLDGGRVLAEGKAEWQPGARPFPFLLPPSFTGALRQGNYSLVAASPGLTSVPQPLRIGPGMGDPGLLLVQYGDYGQTFPGGNAWDAPETVMAHLNRTTRQGFNLMVDRLGFPLQLGALNWPNDGDTAQIRDLGKRLEADPVGVAPEKAEAEPPLLLTQAGYSSQGIRQMSILLGNDAGLPIGTGFDTRKPEQFTADITKVTEALIPYPSFRGWSWAANNWPSPAGAAAAKTPEEKAAYEAALKKARETGEWDPILDRVSGYWLDYAPAAQEFFNKTLKNLAPGAITAWAAPFRSMYAYPPVTFSHVDEVDLQAQWEQVEVPYHAPFNVDFYKRPGKRAWGHPEVWNDSGTGDQILPTLFQMVMRGADGVGLSGGVPNWGNMGSDPRQSTQGMPSVVRAMNGLLRQYGPWLESLQKDDRVALVADGRMVKIDEWPGTMPRHFSRMFEAYLSCLHAHHPASILFSEDIGPESLKKFKAVLLVGQRVEMEPGLLAALEAAKASGTAIFYDGMCRESLVKEFHPLQISFDKVEKDAHQASDDDAFLRFSEYARQNTPALLQALDPVTPPTARLEKDEVFVSQSKEEEGRYLFVVNASTPSELGPGRMWRVNLFATSRVPVAPEIGLLPGGGAPTLAHTKPAVYDVFALRQVQPEKGMVTADLRSLPMRIFAELPAAIHGIVLEGPDSVAAGTNFSYSVRVVDAAGKPIHAAAPVRFRLLSLDGEVLEERFLNVTSKGAYGHTRALLNAPGASQVLEAVELFSGKAARLSFAVKPVSKIPLTPGASSGDDGAFPGVNDGISHTAPSSVAPAEESFGPHIRDMVLSGNQAVINTMNWDKNLYGLDLDTGKMVWRQKVGGYFAFAPQALREGTAVQGFDFDSAEGYHLYLVDRTGKLQRRFALYGLPGRLPQRFVPGIFHDRIDNFAIPEEGNWAASAGDLGIAVWDRGGKLLWTRDTWKKNRFLARYSPASDWNTSQPHTPLLAALDRDTLLVMDGMNLEAYHATTGETAWSLTLASNGEIRQARMSGDGRTLALLSTSDGGHLYLLRAVGKEWKLMNTLPTGGDDLAVSPDGALTAVVLNNQLKMYRTNGGLEWILPGDDNLRFPRFSADRLAVSSDLGTTYIVGMDGKVLHEQDMGALAVPLWLPGGDLLLGNWMGRVVRLDDTYKERWRTLLRPAGIPKLSVSPFKPRVVKVKLDPVGISRRAGLEPTSESRGVESRDVESRNAESHNPESWKVEEIPTSRVSGWGNAAPTPLPLTPNLLAETKAIIRFVGGSLSFAHDPAPLVDGKPDAPAEPWLSWGDINWLAETSLFNYILLDAFHTQMRVTGITLVEDPQHPESWLRDAYIEYWDPANEKWVFIQPLLSDSAAHTHLFVHPIEAARLRIVLPFGLPGNLRMGEIVLYGEVLGSSHPDVAARRPVAVLFDENQEDLKSMAGGGVSFLLEGAYSGGRALRLEGDKAAVPAWQPPFGHVIPNWDFEIMENPRPGQYRYLQFAWKALSPQTRGITLRAADSHFGGIALCAGECTSFEGAASKQVAVTPPQEWKVVRVDLWSLLKKPYNVRSLGLGAVGGPAAFDQILVGRTEADLPPVKE